MKVELGARSDTEPSESPVVQPYLAEALPELFNDAVFSARAVASPHLLGEGVPSPRGRVPTAWTNPPPTSARHYYDLWSLIRRASAEEALADPGLFDRVAEHRQVFFPYGWMDYTTCRPGAFRARARGVTDG